MVIPSEECRMQAISLRIAADDPIYRLIRDPLLHAADCYDCLAELTEQNRQTTHKRSQTG